MTSMPPLTLTAALSIRLSKVSAIPLPPKRDRPSQPISFVRAPRYRREQPRSTNSARFESGRVAAVLGLMSIRTHCASPPLTFEEWGLSSAQHRQRSRSWLSRSPSLCVCSIDATNCFCLNFATSDDEDDGDQYERPRSSVSDSRG